MDRVTMIIITSCKNVHTFELMRHEAEELKDKLLKERDDLAIFIKEDYERSS